MRARFRDEAKFKRFRIGDDITNALADITDAEYSARYHRMIGRFKPGVDHAGQSH